MTDAEIEAYAATSPGRKVMVPVKTFPEFLAEHDLTLNDVQVLPNDWGEAIFGRMNGCATARDVAKTRAAHKRIAVNSEWQKRYREAIADGTIPQQETYVPLDLNRESDRAYVRTRIRRAQAREKKCPT